MAALRKLFMALCPGCIVVSNVDTIGTSCHRAAYLFHATLEAVLFVEILMDDSHIDILARGPVMLA